MSGSGESLGVPYLDAASLNALLPMSAAIDALEESLRGVVPEAPERHVHPTDTGELLLMPSWGEPGAGVKLITLRPDNPPRDLPLIQGVFVMFSAEDSRPAVVMDGAALTALRTAAVSGLAARHLAREDATRLTMIGAGRQAHSHLEAMFAVRAVESVTVIDPDQPDRAASLARHAEDLGATSTVAELTSLATTDLLCACTTSPTPVLDGEELPEGIHVTAMGAYRPDMRELDAAALNRSSVYVETRDAALAEAGDLIQAIEEGSWSAEGIAGDLADVINGRAGRRSASERTVFKSVGVAWEDLVVAKAALERAEAASQAQAV